jgi:hypothetical protein
MNEDQRFLGWGVYINSALYLSAVFVTGLVTGNVPARDAAIVAMGLTYISYFAQIAALSRSIAIFAVLASILAGFAAGILLLVTL